MRLMTRRLFAAASGGRMYEGVTPVEVAPWAAAADEFIFVLVEMSCRKVRKVKATVVRIPRDEDPTQWLENVTSALEDVLRKQFEEATQ